MLSVPRSKRDSPCSRPKHVDLGSESVDNTWGLWPATGGIETYGMAPVDSQPGVTAELLERGNHKDKG